MTQLQLKAVMVALVASGLTACATPQYAARNNYTPPAPVAPQYPTHAQPAPHPAPAPPVQAEDASAPPAAAPTSAIESQSLPPPSAAAPARMAQAEQAPQGDITAQSGVVAPQEPAPPEHIVPPSAQQPPAPQPPRLRHRVTQPPRLAAAGKVVGDSGVFFDYQVSKGDHVDALGREYGTTRKIIVEKNHLKPPYGLRPGQILKLPVAKAYVAQSGDTLGEVARRFGVSVGELTELNHISSRAGLRPGQKLGLPPSFSDHGPIRIAGTTVTEYEPAPPPARPAYRSPPSQAAAAPPPAAPAYRPAPQAASAPPVAAPAYTPSNPPPAAARAPQVATAAPPSRAPQPVYTAPPRPQTPDTTPLPPETDIAMAARGRFIWPLHGDILSGFGVKGVGRRNDGLDIKAPQGTVVHAAAGGDVVYAGDQVPGFGNLVLVKHADGWVTAYAHLDRVSVQMRQQVAQGQELGQVGLSGGVTEPQLHFEVRYAPTPQDKAKPVDPVLVLPR